MHNSQNIYKCNLGNSGLIEFLKKRNNDAFGDSHMELSDEGLRDRSSNHLSNVPNVM